MGYSSFFPFPHSLVFSICFDFDKVSYSVNDTIVANANCSDNVIDLSGNGHHGTTSNLVDSDFDTADSPTGV